MEIQVCMSFKKWQKNNKQKRSVLRAIDNFLYSAQKKNCAIELGHHWNKVRPKVYEFRVFSDSKQTFRLYCGEDVSPDDSRILKVAWAGGKQKDSEQHNDMNLAQEILSDDAEEWTVWTPKVRGELKTDDLATENQVLEPESETAPQTADTTPVDNTEQIDEVPVQTTARRATKAKKPKKTSADVAPVTPVVVPTAEKTQSDTTADMSDNEIEVLTPNKPETAPVADTKVSDTTPPASDFQHLTDVQYKLALIDYKMQIESSKIVIAQQTVIIEQAKIAQLQLKIEKLQLVMQSQNQH